jgi:hypothetical protein
MNGRRSVAASDDYDTVALCLKKMMRFLASMTAKSRFSTNEARASIAHNQRLIGN